MEYKVTKVTKDNFYRISYNDGGVKSLLTKLRDTAPALDISMEEILLGLKEIYEPIIIKAIHDSGDAVWANFMAPRTKVTVEPVLAGLRIRVSGKTEGEAGMGKGDGPGQVRGKYDNTYCLWAVQEFGYSFSDKSNKQTKGPKGSARTSQIVKDVGGVKRVTTGQAGAGVKQWKGRVQHVLRSIEAQIMATTRALVKRGAANILNSWLKAAGANVKGFEQNAADLEAMGLSEDVLMGLGVGAISAGGFHEAGTGHFMSLGGMKPMSLG